MRTMRGALVVAQFGPIERREAEPGTARGAGAGQRSSGSTRCCVLSAGIMRGRLSFPQFAIVPKIVTVTIFV